MSRRRNKQIDKRSRHATIRQERKWRVTVFSLLTLYMARSLTVCSTCLRERIVAVHVLKTALKCGSRGVHKLSVDTPALCQNEQNNQSLSSYVPRRPAKYEYSYMHAQLHYTTDYCVRELQKKKIDRSKQTKRR